MDAQTPVSAHGHRFELPLVRPAAGAHHGEVWQPRTLDGAPLPVWVSGCPDCSWRLAWPTWQRALGGALEHYRDTGAAVLLAAVRELPGVVLEAGPDAAVEAYLDARDREEAQEAVRGPSPAPAVAAEPVEPARARRRVWPVLLVMLAVLVLGAAAFTWAVDWRPWL